MELEVGMYVRTNEGLIGKITWCCLKNEECNKWVFTLDTGEYEYSYLELDKKPSHNIIDLIEVGDYVNGKEVIKVSTDYIFDYTEEIKIIYFSEEDYIYSSADIKSIVTKEMFASAEYKVGE